MFPFVNMSLYHDVYLRSSRLTCHHTHGPRGESDILAKIPITKGVGTIIEDKTPDNVHLDLEGNVVGSRNNQLSLPLTIG